MESYFMSGITLKILNYQMSYWPLTFLVLSPFLFSVEKSFIEVVLGGYPLVEQESQPD